MHVAIGDSDIVPAKSLRFRPSVQDDDQEDRFVFIDNEKIDSCSIEATILPERLTMFCGEEIHQKEEEMEKGNLEGEGKRWWQKKNKMAAINTQKLTNAQIKSL